MAKLNHSKDRLSKDTSAVIFSYIVHICCGSYNYCNTFTSLCNGGYQYMNSVYANTVLYSAGKSLKGGRVVQHFDVVL
jgi:hypothetical protein